MDLLKGAAGVVITMAIGGTIYTVNQADVVDNFAEDTGLTQQEATEYVESVDNSELVSYTEIGDQFVTDGNDLLNAASEIDCVNYVYEWESASLNCIQGQAQLNKFGNDEIALGRAFIKLDGPEASRVDIGNTVSLIDTVNEGFQLDIIKAILSASTIDESKKTNSYNKALLEAALEN